MILRRRNQDTQKPVLNRPAKGSPKNNAKKRKRNIPSKYFKTKKFVDEYLVDFDAHAAFVRCGYSKGNSNTDGVLAHRMINRPDVIQLVNERLSARAEKLEITAERIVKEMAILAFSNLRDFIEVKKGSFFLTKPWAELTREQTACIQEVTETRSKLGNTLKIKVYDKQSALINLGKHLGLFWEDSTKAKDPSDIAQKIRQAMKEADKKVPRSKADLKVLSGIK